LLRYGTQRGDGESARRGVEILKAARPQGLSWCAGLPGAALAVAANAVAATDPELSSIVDRAVAALRASGALPDHSLCHGESGALALLGRVTDSRLYTDTFINVRCGTPSALTSAGMLTGLSGIGHGALHLAFPQHVPSVLLLE
jgi:lantibiotic modifying enzyme